MLGALRGAVFGVREVERSSRQCQFFWAMARMKFTQRCSYARKRDARGDEQLRSTRLWRIPYRRVNAVGWNCLIAVAKLKESSDGSVGSGGELRTPRSVIES